MGRKKQNPEDSKKHGQILKIAGKMFMAQPYGSISMDALADAVPVSKRTLYNHFADKKALFTAVMQQRCQTVSETFEQTIRDDRGVEATLTAIGRQFLDLVFEANAINMYRTAITEARQFPELGALFYESGPKRAMGIIAAYLSRAHARGALHVPNPELAANMFFSMLANRLQMKCMLGLKKRVTPKEKQEILRYVIDVFLRGQQPR